MRINATTAGLNNYSQAVMPRRPRPVNTSSDSVRFGVCPVCATGGALAVSGLVALGIKLLGGKSGDKSACTAGKDGAKPVDNPPSSQPTAPPSK